MKMSNAFPSKYLRAADLEDHEVAVTMSHVDIEEITDGEKKPVLYFAGKTKGVVLNKTNTKTIVKEYGDDSDGWRGKTIILYPAMVDFRGDMVEAIRVRTTKTKATYTKTDTTAKHNEANPPPADADDIPF